MGSRHFFLRKKMFSDFAQTSLIISFEKDNFPIQADLRKTFFFGKYYNFIFQKSGIFGKNSLWEIGAFLKPRAKRSALVSRETA